MSRGRSRPPPDIVSGQGEPPPATQVELSLKRMIEAAVPSGRKPRPGDAAQPGRALKRPDEIGRAGRKPG